MQNEASAHFFKIFQLLTENYQFYLNIEKFVKSDVNKVCGGKSNYSRECNQKPLTAGADTMSSLICLSTSLWRVTESRAQPL